MIKDIKAKNENAKPEDRTMQKLRADFPQCFDNEGKFDIDKFRQLIDPQDVTREGYGLEFLGKRYAGLLASADTETVIEPDSAQNQLPENINSQNIYISGDNLDALKHLLKSYSNKIKCIYIDPPYNTGSDGFVYNDKFNFTAAQLQTKLGISDEKAKRILDFTTRGSASHSAWLTFMYPRLLLAKDLLSDDGVIFISIDDNEQANLKLLCDSVFGEENFVAQLMWESKYTVSNDAQYVSGQHEYILFYAKTKESFSIGRLERSEEQNSSYINRDDDPKGPWKATPLHAKSGTENSKYDVTFSNGVTWSCPQGRFPRYSKETLLKLYEAGELYFNKNGGVDKKTYLEEVSKKGVVPGSILHYEIVGHTHGNNEELAELVGKGMFDNPKGVKLISHLSKLANLNPHSDIILDFFSGSATTAHAVMKLNSEDGGTRRFIMVQIPDKTPSDSEANKAGYATIDQIGQERIRRAAKKIREDSENQISTKQSQLSAKEQKLAEESQQKKLEFDTAQNPFQAEIETLKSEIAEKQHVLDNLDLGFRHYTLRDVSQNVLDKMETFDPKGLLSDGDILKTFGKDTVLATWCVNDGYGFAVETQLIEPLPLANYNAYHCGKHLYMIDGDNFDEDATVALVDTIAGKPELKIENIVLFGYSFNYTQTEMLSKNIKALKTSINIEIRY